MSPVAINGVDKQGVAVNGVQVKQSLSDANETVNKGVYAATTLSAVDLDLAVGNIKSGVTIFGKLGTVVPMDVSDADALVADVKDPKTFYSVAGPRKTGTMATVAILDDNPAYPAGYHAGAASLAAVDAHLAVGNIKNGVSIFGVAGTYAQTLAEDILGSANTAELGGLQSATETLMFKAIGAGASFDLATKTQNYDASSMAIAIAVFFGRSGTGGRLKIQCVMDAIVVATSSFIVNGPATLYLTIGTKALSGAKICICRVNSPTTADNILFETSGNGHPCGAGIAVGSIKLV